MTSCKTNNCSELYPSKCVVITATLEDSSVFTLDCTANLNDLILQIDDHLQKLYAEYGINIAALYNNSSELICDHPKLTTLINTSDNYLDDARTLLKSTNVVETLLEIICEQNARIITLESGSFVNMNLSAELVAFLSSRLACINFTDDCGNLVIPGTYEELLMALIKKLCP